MRFSLGQADDVVPTVTIPELWIDLNTYCRTKGTDEQCVGLLGVNPLYIPQPCVTGVPWWAIMAIGFIIGRNL